jgi:hypothetical protein
MTMRKATGLLMRYELAMAVSEVYKEFIEVCITRGYVNMTNECLNIGGARRFQRSWTGEMAYRERSHYCQ